MKPVVFASFEDEAGDRCVDIVRLSDGAYTFRECRRDPEDSHGWRHLSAAINATYPTQDAAQHAAFEAISWLAIMHRG